MAGRSTELKSKWAASQPRASNPRLQDGDSERQRILELGEARVLSLGCTPDSGIVLSPALLDPPSPTPPFAPLEAAYCITSQPGGEVLPDLSPMFPLLLFLLPGATHNEAAPSVTGLITLEKSAARLEEHSACPGYPCSHPTLALS